MGENKRYYWLKLKTDFFSQKEIKKLRKIAGGDTYTIIYLKLQLLSLKNEGVIYYEGVEDSFYDEMALELDEEAENVKITILFLQKYGLIEERAESEFLLPKATESIGTETQCAERVRKHRENKKALPCNTVVTISNTEIEKEKELELDTEIEKEKKSTSPKLRFSEEDIEFGDHLRHCILINNPKAKIPKNMDKWYNTFRLMREVDKRLPDDIGIVLDWCQKDSFWKSNILSPDSLRKHFDQLSLKVKQEPAKRMYKPESQMDMLQNVLRRYEGGTEQDAKDTCTIDISVPE